MFLPVLRGGLPLAVALAVLVTPTYAVAAPPQRTIQIKDECNPATFNAALGPGMCVGNGAVTFQQFLSELQQLHRAPQWQFVPDQVQVNVNEPFVATNVGGETHTFTEVDAFGGGFVDFLNGLAGTPVPAPECGHFVGGTLVPSAPALASLVPPGGSYTDSEDATGTKLYQCCIHPWMHETVNVRQIGAVVP